MHWRQARELGEERESTSFDVDGLEAEGSYEAGTDHSEEVEDSENSETLADDISVEEFSEEEFSEEEEEESTESEEEDSENSESESEYRRRKALRRYKVDRLSSLPNDLLKRIFDFAHPIDALPKGPLSKRLLPFYTSIRQRRINLESKEKVKTLIRSVNSNPSIGAKIEILHIGLREEDLCLGFGFSVRMFGGGGRQSTPHLSSSEVAMFYRHLRNIQEIKLPEGRESHFYAIRPFLPSPTRPNLPRLEKLVTTPSYVGRNPLRFFNSFIQLRSLTLTSYKVDDDGRLMYAPASLPFLTELSVSGWAADNDTVAEFCRYCPQLSKLSLSTDDPGYDRLLPRLPSTITSLSLLNANGIEDPIQFDCDDQLHRFPNLTSLTLGNYLFSSNLPHYLNSHHTRLEHLDLGRGKISADGMVEFLERGDSRLKSLKLDLIEPGHESSAGGKDTLRTGRYLAPDPEESLLSDIIRPEFDSKGGEFTFDGAQNIIAVAKEKGIKVKGSLGKAVRFYLPFMVEVSNDAILKCFRDENFRHYIKLQEQPEYEHALPPLDLDNLDPHNLELVQKRSEETKLYYLTLENREDFGDGKTTSSGGEIVKVHFDWAGDYVSGSPLSS
ncbi:hypothetical protein JCM5350_003645 [Sporobolomyces pararoseus]